MTVQVFKNILVIGDGGVGKATLVNRLVNGEFEPKYVASTGVTTHIIGNFKITVFPGQYRYSFDKMIYDNEEYNIQYDRIVVMCDINSQLSFNNAFEWVKLTRGLCHKNTRIVILSNKCEVDGKYFSNEWIANAAKKYKDLSFLSKWKTEKLTQFDRMYYTSAKTNLNIYTILGDSDEPGLKLEPKAPSEVLISDTDHDRIYGNTADKRLEGINELTAVSSGVTAQ